MGSDDTLKEERIKRKKNTETKKGSSGDANHCLMDMGDPQKAEKKR